MRRHRPGEHMTREQARALAARARGRAIYDARTAHTVRDLGTRKQARLTSGGDR